MPQLDSKILDDNINFWEKRYVQKAVQWHLEEVNPILTKHLPTVLKEVSEDKQSTTKSKKFFIPLCGMTKDIPYLLSLGHEIFGVECIQSAIQRLDEENNFNLNFDVEKSLYYTENGRLQIYFGDFFKCPIENWGPFDCVWDRGSLIAMDYALREAYVGMMKRALDHGTGKKFAYLLQTVRYDKSKFAGPPKCVEMMDMATLYEPWTEVKELEKYIVPDDSSMRKVSGAFEGDFHEIIFLLTKKSPV